MAGDGAPPDMAIGTAERLLDGVAMLVQSGGAVVVILLAMSVFAMAVVLAKLMQFHSAALGDGNVAREALALYRKGEADRSLQVASGSAHPAAQALAQVVTGRQRGVGDAVIREEVSRVGNRALEELRSWLRSLEVIASLAPLLGLFGTVLGMIAAFRQLEAAGDQVNPAILSGGIWEALLTTAVGLAVAIPSVAALNWLERRVERVAHEMEDVVAGAFTQDLGLMRGGIGHGHVADSAAVSSSA